MRSIAILGDNFYKWGGGIDFLSLVLKALDHDDYVVNVFMPKQQGPKVTNLIINSLSILKNYDIKIMTDPLGMKDCALVNTYQKGGDRNDFMDLLAQGHEGLEIIHYDNISDLRKKLVTKKVDICLPAFSCLGEKFPIPWIGYLFDMQHKYFPNYFSDSTRKFRDREFSWMMHHSKFLLVGSKAVMNDLKKYYPDCDTHVFTLPFAPAKPSFDPSDEREETLKKYNITNKYMIISNQFWSHKNHITAFKALRDLIEGGVTDLELICTGSTLDWGSSNNFANLSEYIKKHGLENHIKILGRIPKKDQIRLMYNSLALIQPTLFEGGPGGGAVFDAVTYGVPAIVSDIPVNREIVGADVEFFDAEDHVQLCNIMRSRLQNNPSRISHVTLVQQGEQRDREIKQFFRKMIDKAINEY